ncbi:hypothetical protein [Nonomuraea africana]|uniref:Uncharacterized protein n=1 Tax=Nonomuraea africana TaxID=46171 RepID=A0ABR9K602_9ACTN|nr:hypothetical protein [Nonomuraea africana]MBE1557444.1 hypothetical protein [Nonomuraea africana]
MNLDVSREQLRSAFLPHALRPEFDHHNDTFWVPQDSDPPALHYAWMLADIAAYPDAWQGYQVGRANRVFLARITTDGLRRAHVLVRVNGGDGHEEEIDIACGAEPDVGLGYSIVDRASRSSS